MLEAVAATMKKLVALKSNLQKVDKSVARKKVQLLYRRKLSCT